MSNLKAVQLTNEEKATIFEMFLPDVGEEHYHVDEEDSIQHATFPSEGIFKKENGQWLVGTLTVPKPYQSSGTQYPTVYRVGSLVEAIAIYSSYINGPTGDI